MIGQSAADQGTEPTPIRRIAKPIAVMAENPDSREHGKRQVTDADERETDSNQPGGLDGPEDHDDSREREGDKEPKPVTERQKVVDGVASGCQCEQSSKRLALELKAIGQRNQHDELAEHEQIPAQVRVVGRTGGVFPRANSSAFVNSGPRLAELGRRSRR